MVKRWSWEFRDFFLFKFFMKNFNQIFISHQNYLIWLCANTIRTLDEDKPKNYKQLYGEEKIHIIRSLHNVFFGTKTGTNLTMVKCSSIQRNTAHHSFLVKYIICIVLNPEQTRKNFIENYYG